MQTLRHNEKDDFVITACDTTSQEVTHSKGEYEMLQTLQKAEYQKIIRNSGHVLHSHVTNERYHYAISHNGAEVPANQGTATDGSRCRLADDTQSSRETKLFHTQQEYIRTVRGRAESRRHNITRHQPYEMPPTHAREYDVGVSDSSSDEDGCGQHRSRERNDGQLNVEVLDQLSTGSKSKVPEEVRLRINSRERQRMHDLNLALDSLRQVT